MYSKNLFESINLIENILIVGVQNNELDSKYIFIILLNYLILISILLLKVFAQMVLMNQIN